MIQSSSEWKTRSNQEIAALKPRECGKRVALVRDLLIENSSRIRLEYLRPLVPPRWPVTDYQRCARRSERFARLRSTLRSVSAWRDLIPEGYDAQTSGLHRSKARMPNR